MPTYEYRCKSCSHEFEHFQSMKDAPLRKCPECGKNTLERLIGTGAAVIFKGSGFYQTDYRNEEYKKAAEADKPKSESASNDKAATDTKSPADSKTESKTELKTESKTESKSDSKSETKTEKAPAETSSKSRSASKPSTSKSKSTKKSTK